MSELTATHRSHKWRVNAALIAALIAIFALSMTLGGRHAAEGEQSFAGSDSAAVTALEEQHVTPWFEPIFQPGSGEIESGLFALQAALGAGLLGFALGNLRGRRSARVAAVGTDPDAVGSSTPTSTSNATARSNEDHRN